MSRYNIWEKWKNLNHRVSDTANEANRLDNLLLIQEHRITVLERELELLRNCLLSIHSPVAVTGEIENSRPRLKQDRPNSIVECQARLEKEAPQAYRVYQQLMKNNIECYADETLDSCSVEGHAAADGFKTFISRYLRGYVLDVGCGQQRKPSYLADLPDDLIFGIDPLLPHEPHSFEYQQAVSEFIPWEDEAFQNVIFATSVDHVFLLDKTWQEAYRVLAEGGYLLIWIGFDENAPKYNPYADDFKPYDKYHMFHYTMKDFRQDLGGYFKEIECYKGKGNTFYFAFQKKRGI